MSSPELLKFMGTKTCVCVFNEQTSATRHCRFLRSPTQSGQEGKEKKRGRSRREGKDEMKVDEIPLILCSNNTEATKQNITKEGKYYCPAFSESDYLVKKLCFYGLLRLS